MKCFVVFWALTYNLFYYQRECVKRFLLCWALRYSCSLSGWTCSGLGQTDGTGSTLGNDTDFYLRHHVQEWCADTETTWPSLYSVRTGCIAVSTVIQQPQTRGFHSSSYSGGPGTNTYPETGYSDVIVRCFSK
jgi:hypothetical protein